MIQINCHLPKTTDREVITIDRWFAPETLERLVKFREDEVPLEVYMDSPWGFVAKVEQVTSGISEQYRQVIPDDRRPFLFGRLIISVPKGDIADKLIYKLERRDTLQLMDDYTLRTANKLALLPTERERYSSILEQLTFHRSVPEYEQGTWCDEIYVSMTGGCVYMTTRTHNPRKLYDHLDRYAQASQWDHVKTFKELVESAEHVRVNFKYGDIMDGEATSYSLLIPTEEEYQYTECSMNDQGWLYTGDVSIRNSLEDYEIMKAEQGLETIFKMSLLQMYNP